MGLEPTTFGTTIRRSNQLSYIHRKTRNIFSYCGANIITIIQCCKPTLKIFTVARPTENRQPITENRYNTGSLSLSASVAGRLLTSASPFRLLSTQQTDSSNRRNLRCIISTAKQKYTIVRTQSHRYSGMTSPSDAPITLRRIYPVMAELDGNICPTE